MFKVSYPLLDNDIESCLVEYLVLIVLIIFYALRWQTQVKCLYITQWTVIFKTHVMVILQKWCIKVHAILNVKFLE